MESIGVVLNTIGASMRTEELLPVQSLRGAANSRGARETNAELEEKAGLLSEQKDIEIKNREIARRAARLEEKARSSRALEVQVRLPREHVARAAHAAEHPAHPRRLLADNEEGTLTTKQVEYARTICSAGNDLLSLINEILDLSKVEAGKMEVNLAPSRSPTSARTSSARSGRSPSRRGSSSRSRSARAAAVDRHRRAAAAADPEEPALERVQVHRAGGGDAAIGYAGDGGSAATRSPAEQRDRFAVRDTGIGIPDDKLRHLRGVPAGRRPTSRIRRHGARAPITREIARLLGGEIRVDSDVGIGSVFTLRLPLTERPVEPQSDEREDGPAHPLPQSPTIDVPQARALADDGALPAEGALADDRLTLEPDQPVVLVIDSDSQRAAATLEIGPRARRQRHRRAPCKRCARARSRAPAARGHARR